MNTAVFILIFLNFSKIKSPHFSSCFNFMRLVIVLILFNCYPMIIMANEIKYNHNSKTIAELQKEALEIRTSPWIMLHYMDSKYTKLMVSIDLRKGTRVIYDGWSYSKWVNIKGNIGYYQWFGNGGKVNHYGELIIGWLLRWAQDGTSVEMLSYSLSQNQILEIAR